MGKISKDKGKRFERQVASLLRDYGYPAHRTAQFRGNTGRAGDVEGVPHVHIECKHQERMCLYDWISQSSADAAAEGKGNLPAVIHKANNKLILVTMSFEDWIKMYREYASGKDLEVI